MRISIGLAALWLWNAVAYHALLFTRINGAAWLFAGLFAAQAALFIWPMRHRTLKYLVRRGVRMAAGLALAAYALTYPFLTMALGHAYPAVPSFGVPCPTAILTIGLLLTVPGRLPLRIVVIPILWGLIGGSAAVLLGVATDYVLFLAGSALALVVLGERLRPTATLGGAMFAPPRTGGIHGHN
jgi:hypothetical protein